MARLSLFACGVGLPAEITSGRRSILVVDDERGPREALRLIFERTYEVAMAESGEQAVALLKRRSFDLVTLDLKMPGMSGVQTLTAIRKIDATLDVVVVTGFGSYEAAIEAMRLQAYDFLTKPFEVGNVLDTVKRAFARREDRSNRAAGGGIEDLVGHVLHEIDRLDGQIGPRLAEAERRTIDRLRLFSLALREEIHRRAREESLHGGPEEE